MPAPVAATGGEGIVEATGLRKQYGDTAAVAGVSLSVRPGEVFGFFGPNGAGKTTTIRVLTGLTAPTEGEATVCGLDLRANPTQVRRFLGLLPEEAAFYERMTPTTYLGFFASLCGLSGRRRRERIEEVVAIAEIRDFMRKPIADLSHGQRQRVALARVLLAQLPMLFLDEPFQGVDIIHRRSLRQHLRSYAKAGGTVFFTSHNLIEAEHIVDRFAFIDKGRMLKVGTASELRDRYLLPSYAVRTSDPAAAEAALRRALDPPECAVVGDEVHLTLRERKDVPKVAVALGTAGIDLLEMRLQGTMEEVFLRLREESSRQEGAP